MYKRRNKCLSGIKVWCNENKYSLLIILAAIMGLTLGFIMKSIFTISPIALVYIGLPGTLLIRAFKMIIVPFIVSSLSTNTSLDNCIKQVYITLVFKMPGVRDVSAREASHRDVTAGQSSSPVGRDIKQMISSQDESIYDMFMNLVPDNIIAAAFTTHYTALVPLDPQNLTLGYKKVAERAVKPNMLGLCVFALVLGFAVLQLDSKAENIRNILYETNAVILTIMIVMPIGMFCWMFVEAVKMKSPSKIIGQLGMLYITAIITFSCIWFVVYPTVYFLIVRKNPFKFYATITPRPNTAGYHKDNDGKISPTSIGGTVCVATGIFTLIMSMAIPSAPASGGSLVHFISYCAVIGIDYPLDILAYTMTMDWLMDRMRTVTNVLGDCFISAIVQKLCHIKSDITDDYNLAQMLPPISG
ncbi:unnamed protein product [Medioppia subpectinata]|uniref:Amino acid transporter n=1 Tax=Medioppia subpectinata TaxID=1979941 RepID=A0A7R9PVH7_9ACAR|nr:unnamed protein product [Medioppia subpectinata]CAG2102659.1 unnamed protein product [Medioppia subpectinata]